MAPKFSSIKTFAGPETPETCLFAPCWAESPPFRPLMGPQILRKRQKFPGEARMKKARPRGARPGPFVEESFP